MSNKQKAVLIVVVAALAVLVYLQFRAWRSFDWAKFVEGTEGIDWSHVLVGVMFIYGADFLRAVRWKIFLRPTSPKASWTGLIAPQYVGFTGLALLGRPGEFVRPYLIARREGQSVASQVAIWFVERAFDTGAVTLMLAADIFLVPTMRLNYPQWRPAGYALIAAFVSFVIAIWALWKHGVPIAAWFCRRLGRISPRLGARADHKLRAVAAGLNAIHDKRSFFECCLLSLCIWTLVALAYRQVTHAYPVATGLPALELPEVILLMGASVVGGVIQLPVVGGGSQLATIAVLSQTFGYQDAPELAVSCGILLWLVAFMSVVPLGLALARHEHLSLRKLGEESQQAEAAAEAEIAPKSGS